MKNKTAYIFFIIVLYFWLFYPPFWIFRDRLIISNVICLVCILLCMTKPRIYRDFYYRFKKEFMYCGGLLFLSFFLTFFDFQTKVLTQHLLMFVNLFAVIPVLFYYAKKNDFGTESQIVRALLIVSCIGAFFSVMCIINPEFNQYVKYSLIKYDEDNFLFDLDYRGFGIASGLTSTYGYVMGFIGALGVFYIKENRWYLFALPFVFISVLLNARTGIIVMLMGIVLSFLRGRNFIGTAAVAVAAVLFASYFDTFLAMLNVNDEAIKWVMDFQEQAEEAASSGNIRDARQANMLLGEMWVLPDDLLQWITGRGYYLFRNEHGVRASDVGWINELAYGGLIYLIPLLLLFYWIYRNVRHSKSLWYGLFFLMTIIVVNTKSTIFPSSVMFYTLMMMYFVTSKTEFNVSSPMSTRKILQTKNNDYFSDR